MAQIERSIYFLKVVLNYSFIFLVVVHGFGLEKAQTFERLVLKLGKEGTYLDSVKIVEQRYFIMERFLSIVMMIFLSYSGIDDNIAHNYEGYPLIR